MSKPSGGTILAFDFGGRRIGIAVGELSLSSASALTTIRAQRGEADWPALDPLIAEWQPVTLVVGLPCHKDGIESVSSKMARQFAEHLQTRYKLPVELVDENLTSRAADAELRQLRRSGLMRRRVTQGDNDRIAARLILETWMNQTNKGPKE
ncbi:MAG: Holliday junction resolvase RuvX [Gammaproteobacteria bacterium]|nr:Holliday junction resolvase RuvX [Gammaproteobacteria bacterium]NNF66752.1 Holliday junction resolvase RuvX [Gammaproteobacteria bacterium]